MGFYLLDEIGMEFERGLRHQPGIRNCQPLPHRKRAERQLRTERELRNALLAADVREYSVKHREEGFGARLPDGVDELYLEVDGIVREHERLLSMRAALKRGLARLVELGSAEPRDPLVRL